MTHLITNTESHKHSKPDLISLHSRWQPSQGIIVDFHTGACWKPAPELRCPGLQWPAGLKPTERRSQMWNILTMILKSIILSETVLDILPRSSGLAPLCNGHRGGGICFIQAPSLKRPSCVSKLMNLSLWLMYIKRSTIHQNPSISPTHSKFALQCVKGFWRLLHHLKRTWCMPAMGLGFS